MLLKIVGNVCLALAVLLYAVPLPMIRFDASNHTDAAQSQGWAAILTLGPLWILLALALCVSTAAGGLDWLSISRGGQYTLAVLVCLGLGVISCLIVLVQGGPAGDVPWAIRPLAGWMIWLFPAVAMPFCLLTVNREWGAGLPRGVLQVPMGALGILSLVVSAALLLELVVQTQQTQARRVASLVAQDDQRTQQRIAEAQALEPDKNLSNALGYTNRFDDPRTRSAALAKIFAVPDLEAQLAAGLRSEWCEEVLIFLDGSDAPDNRALAEPARDCFLILGKRAAARAHDVDDHLFPDSFDFDARLVLSVADKFRPFGVDYAPAIQAFRDGIGQPRTDKVKFNASASLSDWLAHNAKRSK